ncbi:hypothetical protein HAX54_010647, partial [Datura stramonium]|nr:hypothetical protein [Datura stramonium]
RITSSRQRNKGKAPMVASSSQEVPGEEVEQVAQLRFGHGKMETYYTSFKEKYTITVEA